MLIKKILNQNYLISKLSPGLSLQSSSDQVFRALIIQFNFNINSIHLLLQLIK